MKNLHPELQQFFDLRNRVLENKNYETAYKEFEWPHISKFNWALDYFDIIAKNNNQPALIYTNDDGNTIQRTFEEMRVKSNQVANYLNDLGMVKGDRVFIIMDSSVELFEIMLGIIKAGGVIIPGSTLLKSSDIGDRIIRGEIKFVISHNNYHERFVALTDELKQLKAMICVRKTMINCSEHTSDDIPQWNVYTEVSKYDEEYEASFITYTTDLMFAFFTSGTTAQPKMVFHTHHYPIGHLTTTNWLKLQDDDVHFNISSPGWAKYAWSSFIAPWNAGSTVFIYAYTAFNPDKTLRKLEEFKVTSLCAPLSVWKLFTLEKIEKYKLYLKKIVSAGEPLNSEIFNKVKDQFGLELYEGYGQTETTLLVGTFKGMKIKPGSMGKASPGYEVKLVDEQLNEVAQGEDGQIAVVTSPIRPLGLLLGYDDNEKNKDIFKGALYLTGDTAYADKDGYFHFVGRTDDVFKSLDYRISPFEVESEIMKHQAVLEVGVIPVVDARDRIVPKAFIVLKPDYMPNKQMALELFRFIRDNMAPYKRPRSVEFMKEFPKTISAKVMRRELRGYDNELKSNNKQGEHEYLESAFSKELNIKKRT